MPFQSDLDRCPIAVPADVYQYVTDHNPVAAIEAATAAQQAAAQYESIISTQVTVPASVSSLAALIEAVALDSVAGEDVGTADVDVLEYSGTVDIPPGTVISAGSFGINIELTTGGAVTIGEDGTPAVLELAGTDHTGTIAYETGEWTLTLVGDTAVDEGAITADYDLEYNLDVVGEIRGLWMSPGAADEIYATYSEDGEPTAATGILLAEPVFLAGQPNLIANAKFFGNNTLMDIEVMV